MQITARDATQKAFSKPAVISLLLTLLEVIMITHTRLKELVHYNPDTGLFTSKGPTRGGVVAGTVLGSKDKKGYLLIGLLGKRYKAHRLAFLYMEGNFPIHLVDHKDLDKTNNKWSNLRKATNAENLQNRHTALRNNLSSGLLGVSYCTVMNKYRARISKDRLQYLLGYFDTKEEAHACYIEAKQKIHQFNTL